MVEAVIEGVREGCKAFDVQARLIGIMSRTFGEAACLQELEALLAHRDAITAVDRPGMNWASRAACSCHISTAHVMPAGMLPYTPVKWRGRRASGRPSVNWVPSVSVTV